MVAGGSIGEMVVGAGQGSTTPTTGLWISSELRKTPPSVNELPLDSRNPKYRKVRGRWMESMAYLMVEAGNVLPRRLERVEAGAVLVFDTHRRRDTDNYRAHLSKWLGDLLQHTGRLEDDTPEHFAFGPIEFGVAARPATTLVLRYTERAS